MNREQEIFKNGSTTYYFSSKFFPKSSRIDVFRFYSFVRLADDFVDKIPADKSSFFKLEKLWNKVYKNDELLKINKKSGDIERVVNNLFIVYKKYNFDPDWVIAFLDSMKMDINKYEYKTMSETLKYIYGSAEVIGLMMSQILGVDKKAYKYAKLQGRAMQYINFIRDISEDNQLKRLYFPKSELRKFGLVSLSEHDIVGHRSEFNEFVEAQILKYESWQKEANKGFKFIPYKQRIAVRTAVDCYNWTARKIAKYPVVVFDKKVKPSKMRVLTRAILRFLHA